MDKEENQDVHHVAVDEWEWHTDDLDALKKLCQRVEGILWIGFDRVTVNTKLKEGEELMKTCQQLSFLMPQLGCSMRNTRAIIEEAKKAVGLFHDEIDVPTGNFPVGIPPTVISLEDKSDPAKVRVAFAQALQEARLRSQNSITIIFNTARYGGLSKEQCSVAIEAIKELCHERQELCCTYFIWNYTGLSFGNPRHLNTNKGVIITDPKGAEGYESPTIVSYGGEEGGTGTWSAANFYMRAMAHLIVVKAEATDSDSDSGAPPAQGDTPWPT